MVIMDAPVVEHYIDWEVREEVLQRIGLALESSQPKTDLATIKQS